MVWGDIGAVGEAGLMPVRNLLKGITWRRCNTKSSMS
jgi:hypothetical protein